MVHQGKKAVKKGFSKMKLFLCAKIVDKKYVTYYIVYIGNILHIIRGAFYELR